jgi:short-subunit dehydrogenase
MSTSYLPEKYGRWAVVTGASSGIGKAFAVHLASQGFNLVITARRQTELYEIANSLEQQFGVESIVVVLDLTSEGATEQLIRRCNELEVGVFVASAGFGSSGQFTESSVKEELEMIDVNCRVVTEQIYHFAKVFSKKGSGAIILLSSVVAFQGVPLSSVYAATKAFVQTLAEGLHFELKNHSVDVLAVAPGPVKSGFSERARLSPGKLEDPEIIARQSIAALGKRVTVRPGFLAKLLDLALTLPRAMRIRIMSLVMAGMTKDQAH